MNWVAYLIYCAIILAGYGLWIALFVSMKSGSQKKKDSVGYALLGPMHAYLRKRGYTLTTREMVGWGVILLFLLVLPLLS